MSQRFTQEQRALFEIVSASLKGEKVNNELLDCNIDWEKLLEIATKHAVVPIMYEALENVEKVPSDVMEYVAVISRRVALQNYRLLALTQNIICHLKDNGIDVVTLKGVGTASYYPLFEERKAGDVDLLVRQDVDVEHLTNVCKEFGLLVAQSQHANHHIVFKSNDGIDIEVHKLSVEPFANKKINEGIMKVLPTYFDNIMERDIIGVKIPILNKPYHALQLLLHMLQHFMYAGFGLKLLCDWVVILRQDWNDEEKKNLEKLVGQCELQGFASMVTLVCHKYFGLEERFIPHWLLREMPCEIFLEDVLEAEEFGYSSRARMVMMKDSSVKSFLNEFHHQMHLNYPRAGKLWVIWPALWIITLVRFLANNKTVRNTSTMQILKKAKERSRLMEEIQIFDGK